MVEKLLNISRDKRLKIFVVTSAFVIAAFFIYFPNYAKLEKLKRDNSALNIENKRLEEEIADYEEKILRVGKDSYLYEKIVRDDLGAAKEGEIVIDIVR
ncbi:MAG: septum formation initiator family protein [Candidatus Omnitrophota bacterium]